MAKLVLAGRSFEIAPYDIDDMILVAPHVDAFQSLGKPTDFATLLESMKHGAAILSVGLQKIDPGITITAIVKMALADKTQALGIAVADVLAEFGLVPAGEAKAPVKRRKAAGA